MFFNKVKKTQSFVWDIGNFQEIYNLIVPTLDMKKLINTSAPF